MMMGVEGLVQAFGAGGLRSARDCLAACLWCAVLGKMWRSCRNITGTNIIITLAARNPRADGGVMRCDRGSGGGEAVGRYARS